MTASAEATCSLTGAAGAVAECSCTAARTVQVTAGARSTHSSSRAVASTETTAEAAHAYTGAGVVWMTASARGPIVRTLNQELCG